MTDNLDSLLTEAEAAAYLRIAAKHLARLRRLKRIASIRVTPRRHLYSEVHLKDYLAARTGRLSANEPLSANGPRSLAHASPASKVTLFNEPQGPVLPGMYLRRDGTMRRRPRVRRTFGELPGPVRMRRARKALASFLPVLPSIP